MHDDESAYPNIRSPISQTGLLRCPIDLPRKLVPTFFNTPQTPWTGSRGEKRRLPQRRRRISPFSSPSAIRRAIGATSWPTRASKTLGLPRCSTRTSSRSKWIARSVRTSTSCTWRRCRCSWAMAGGRCPSSSRRHWSLSSAVPTGLPVLADRYPASTKSCTRSRRLGSTAAVRPWNRPGNSRRCSANRFAARGGSKPPTSLKRL